MKANGIGSAATYDTVPLDVQVGVLSSNGRRFLEVLGKLDQLMPLLQTLEIHEVISAQAVDIQRTGLKRQVRDVANGTRNFAMGLRRRMNALGGREGGDGVSIDAGDDLPLLDAEAVSEVSADAVGEVAPTSVVEAEVGQVA